MLKHYKFYFAIAILPLMLLVKIVGAYPDFIEMYYSSKLYPFISKIFRYTLGWLPFSFGDIFYGLAIIYMVKWFFGKRKFMLKNTRSWFVSVFAAISIIYAAFHLLWGFNYYRLPLHESLHLKATYTSEQLMQTITKLTQKSNALHEVLTISDTLPVKMPYSKNDILKMIPEGYGVLGKKFPQFHYNPKSLKKSLFSLPLSYMGFSGYLNPLTNEAQVNYLIPAYKFPTTASHEVAHQLGYAAENEANFIGFLATINHPDAYFNYSGYTFGLKHCLFELYKRDPEKYQEMLSAIRPGILKNYEIVQTFWHHYKNPFEPIFENTYNQFLKANNQPKGMQSYNYVVALLVNYLQ